MIKSIYKIIKPSDLKTTYIGSTGTPLDIRMAKHKCKPLKSLKDWLDKTCEIELIESIEVPGIEKATRKAFEAIEFEWIAKYRANGYTVLNYRDGKSKVEGYTKVMSDKQSAIYKESGYTKVMSDKYSAIYKESGHTKSRNAERHPDYSYWLTKLYRIAKKEGLTIKQYCKIYGPQIYLGPKKKISN